MTRQVFDRELHKLQDSLLALGSEVEANIIESVRILRQRDDIRARRLIARDEDVNYKHIDLERRCLTVIATQQPTAGDLRLIASVISIASELERINDYAKGIAKIHLLIGEEPLLAPAGALQPMAEKAADMLQRSLQAFARRDPDMARVIHAEDDEVDDMYNDIYRRLVALITDDVDKMDQATQLLWAAHNLERTADRVSNICERVIFTKTGEILDLSDEMEVSYPA